MKLESEVTMRKQINDFASSVRVEEMPLTFQVTNSDTINNTAEIPTPVGFIEKLDEFVTNYLDELSRYFLTIESCMHCANAVEPIFKMMNFRCSGRRYFGKLHN